MACARKHSLLLEESLKQEKWCMPFLPWILMINL
jgi:hypothetical protein